MSRKDYVAIAMAINEAYKMSDYHPEARHDMERVAGNIARVFAANNPNFDRDRFMAACGVDQ